MSSTIALIVGISKYQASQFTPLPAAQTDAIHFARALSHWGISETTLFLNNEATLNHLNEWFNALTKRTKDYKLLFYFCGHGQREAGPIPSSYLQFFDGRIHLDTLISQICQSGAKESFIFIDACALRINSLLNPKLEEEIKGCKISNNSLFCLLSSGIQESFENNRYGYFTDALLKILARTRKTEPHSSRFFEDICKILKAGDLPLPELYNIGCDKISFLPSTHPFFNPNGLLCRSQMIGKIEDALILNRGKIGVLVGENGIGKTSLGQYLADKPTKTFYVNIPPFSSSSQNLIDTLPFAFRSHPFQDEELSGSLFLLDQAENIFPEQLCRFVEEAADSCIQFLLISNDSLEKNLPAALRSRFFQIAMEPFSSEEGEHFMLPFSCTEKETRLIHLVSRGKPSKMRQVAHCLSQNTIFTHRIEKEELLKTMSAIYGCGCYLEKDLLADVFQLSISSIALFEELALIHWDVDAWVPHPIFYEIAESEPLTIDREKVLEYWYRQMKQSPNMVRAASNLITSVKCFEYEKKADPFLLMAFRALQSDHLDHLDLFIDGAQIFQNHPEMTEASVLLAKILTDLQRFDLAHTLRQAKPLKRHKRIFVWIICSFISLTSLFFYHPFHSSSSHIVNVKRTHPDFVGRDSYLNQLKVICLNWKTAPPVAVLWGEAGIGKSEIAIAFANTHAKHFQLICWINSETEESRAASYYDLAQLLKISVDQEKDIVKAVHTHLENEKSVQPWLLIFDNASEKTELPSKGKGSIIITTRDRAAWQSCNCLEIAPFQEKEAVDLFRKITNCRDPVQVHSLANQLDFFPLTMNLAAHYIAETPEMNEELYLELLSQNNIDLISSMPFDERHPNSLLSSWNITASELAKNNPQTLHWLHFCSYLYPAGIPAAWVEKWLTDIQKESDPFNVKILSGNILRILVNQSLMRFEKNTHILSLHHLKQNVMKRDRFFQKGIADQVAQFLINSSQNIERIYEGKINLPQRTYLREWEPHAAWFINQYSSECSRENIASLQNLMGNWKYFKGDYKAAQSYHEHALKNRIELFGEEHPQTIISMNNLAMILWENGQFAESRDLFSRTLEASKKLYKEDHLDAIATLNNQWGNMEMGQFQEARDLLNQSLHLSKKLDAFDPDFLQTVNDFLQFLDDEANPANGPSTDKEIKRALFLRHAGLWMAEVEGNPAKSLGYFQESLELLKKILPDDDPRIAIAYGSVGISLNRADRSEEGQHYLSKALELQKKILGDDHPETAKSCANLAISLLNLGKHQQALEYHLKALEIRKKTLGDEHPVTAKSYSGTGITLIGFQKYDEALFYNQKALEIRKKTLGENHSETAQSYSRLGINLGKLGRREEALEYNLRALEILNKIFEKNHSSMIKVHMALGTCYTDLDCIEKALFHEQKAEEIRKFLTR
ncbi:MAG: tetratricopeptide repeat protein [Parachlamydiales bacterium]|nr:tetratricopeptide repeat protein [Parachlamydiales bacterium]